MEIVLKNFGKIQHANVKLDGLTLIAGQNDTGKSTIGKSLFALIKSIFDYENLFNDIKKKKVSELLSPLIMEFLKEYKVDEELKKNLTTLRDTILRDNFSQNEQSFELAEIKEYIIQMNSYIEDTLGNNNIKSTVCEIKNLIASNISDLDKLQDVLNKSIFVYGTFFDNLNNSVFFNDKSEIAYIQDESTILFKSVIENNNFHVNEFNTSNLGMSLKDVTFIDTPLFLEEFKNANSAYTEDLIIKKNKLKQNFKDILNKENDEILKLFEQIFNKAQFVYDRKRLKYRVTNEAKDLMIHNIASGSKSFGLLYLFLKAGVITKDSLLILDEPENHLHPAWQIKYAEILCKMVSEGYYVLITSHSPYFIQALKKYSLRDNIFNTKTNFYIAEQVDGENHSIISNIKDKDGNFNEERIFSSLYEPLETLENIKYDI